MIYCKRKKNKRIEKEIQNKKYVWENTNIFLSTSFYNLKEEKFKTQDKAVL